MNIFCGGVCCDLFYAYMCVKVVYIFSFLFHSLISSSSSSSSSRANCTEFTDSLSLCLSASVSIIHRSESLCKSANMVCSCVEVYGLDRCYLKMKCWRTSLMSSSWLPQQWLLCLVHVTWIVGEMVGKWPYNCCLVECYFQNLFETTGSILV